MSLPLLFLAAAVIFNPSSAHAKPSLKTTAELSRWESTGRYEEVLRLCSNFQKAYPGKILCSRFGTTPEGRSMVALIASENGLLDPKANRKANRPVLLAQGGIHAGEIDGKDAGFLALRKLLDGEAAPGVLSQVTFVFVPVFNADGHERFGPHHRPNQVGPKESGWRTTAWNLNLNRDYMKADSPEMKAMLRLLRAWDPILYADLHVTDGAQFQHDVAVMIQPSQAGPKELRTLGLRLQEELMDKLKARGHQPLWFYPRFNKESDPFLGLDLEVASPRYSHAYWALHNRIGILVENHSWKDYPTRVRAAYNVLLSLLELAARDGASWLKAAKAAEEETSHLSDHEVALTYKPTQAHRIMDFLGYASTRTYSDVSGQTWILYDPSKPEIWKIPLYYELKSSLTVSAPKSGYILPPAQAWVSEKLRLHGIEFQILEQPLNLEAGEMETFRATHVSVGQEMFEGRALARVQGEWRPERRPIPAGSLYIPIAQPRAHLAMHLLEPKAPDSLVNWGYFNAFFERKEYIEAYVLEKEAREMMAANPALKVEFEEKLASDSEFAKNPSRRLDFFYQRHPSWDERLNLVPIYRIHKKP